MTREEKIKFIVESIAEFEGVKDTKHLQESIEKWADEQIQEEFEFMSYLWDK